MKNRINNSLQFIDVQMNGEQLGRLALTPDSFCAFEYNADYINKGVSISPFYLPLQPGLFVAKRAPFDGNFGVFNDSLPDGWGNLLLDRYLTQQGISPYGLSQLQRLCLIGTSGRGALAYYPDNAIRNTNEWIAIDKLAAEAEKVLSSNYSSDSLELLYNYGGSSGGARPKFFITLPDGEWLIKFKASTDPENVGVVEYQYSLLAKQCGILMPETRLFEGKYFGVRRFDRENNGKQHVISAAGLLNADYRIPSLDYDLLLRACFKLTQNIEEVYKLFRLMVFNVVIKNRDDHAKNFSFRLYNNAWQLSPAYDLLPSNGFNGYHTTTVNGQGEPTQQDIFAVANKIGLNNQRTKEIYEEIVEKCRDAKIDI